MTDPRQESYDAVMVKVRRYRESKNIAVAYAAIRDAVRAYAIAELEGVLGMGHLPTGTRIHARIVELERERNSPNE